MKKNTFPALIAALCTLAGVLCMAVRQWLLTADTDQKGLLVAGHPGDVISWILTGLVLLTLIAVTVWYKPRCRFYGSGLAGVGIVAQASALAFLSGPLLRSGSTVAVIAVIFALLSLLCCIAKILYRVNMKKFPPLLYFPLVIFYLLFLVYCYQDWSSQPQLQLYVFQLLATVCLTLTAYQRAALALNTGSSTTYFLTSNAAVFFCLAAVPGAEHFLLFLLMAVATLLDGCTASTDREAV